MNKHFVSKRIIVQSDQGLFAVDHWNDTETAYVFVTELSREMRIGGYYIFESKNENIIDKAVAKYILENR